MRWSSGVLGSWPKSKDMLILDPFASLESDADRHRALVDGRDRSEPDFLAQLEPGVKAAAVERVVDPGHPVEPAELLADALHADDTSGLDSWIAEARSGRGHPPVELGDDFADDFPRRRGGSQRLWEQLVAACRPDRNHAGGDHQPQAHAVPVPTDRDVENRLDLRHPDESGHHGDLPHGRDAGREVDDGAAVSEGDV